MKTDPRHAFRAKALIFAAVPLRDKDETEMLLLERLKAKDVLVKRGCTYNPPF